MKNLRDISENGVMSAFTPFVSETKKFINSNEFQSVDSSSQLLFHHSLVTNE